MDHTATASTSTFTLLEPRDGTALVWDDVRIPYRELLAQAHGWAGALAEAGPRVAVFSENRVEWV